MMKRPGLNLLLTLTDMKIIKINLKLKFLKLLTSIMGLVILILFNVKDGYCYEYYLLLSPSDCTKCSPIFKSLEDDFFKANNIKYHVITPFRNEWEGTKLVEEYFMLDKSNIIEIENNVSKFKKFSKSNFSRLVVLKKGKVLLSSEVIGLNFFLLNFKSIYSLNCTLNSLREVILL